MSYLVAGFSDASPDWGIGVMVSAAGDAEPLVSGLEGLKTLRVVEAIQQSADTGETVLLP